MKRGGFTLVEVLVVVAVIAVLAGIIIPLSRSSRRQAMAALCGSNLKQLSLALVTYDQENGTFPYGFDSSDVGTSFPPPVYPGDTFYDWRGLWWFQSFPGTLGKNTEKGTVFWCPDRDISDRRTERNILCGNYGVNRAICPDAVNMGSEFCGKPQSSSRVRRPGETLLISDSGYSLLSWRAATNAAIDRFENDRRQSCFYVPGLEINKTRDIFGGCEQDAIEGRHINESVNIGFVDGHISRVKVEDLYVESRDGEYENLSPLWQPEKGATD